MVNRLREVLQAHESLLTAHVAGDYKDFVNLVCEHYNGFVEDIMGYTMISELKAYAIPCLALYTTLTNEHNVSKEQAVELIYQLTYNVTEDIYTDMSFVQVAYYLMCNKPFLKQLMLHSLAKFSPTDIQDSLEEHEVDEGLHGNLEHSDLATYFQRANQSELLSLLKKLDQVIEVYAKKHFTAEQRNLTVLDLF